MSLELDGPDLDGPDDGLDLVGLRVDIAGRRLVDDLCLRVPGGHVVGLVGPNGSGKSTALRCVYRALVPTGGAVLLDGVDLAGTSLRYRARRIAALTQEGSSDLDFTVREIVALGRAPHRRGNNPLSAPEIELCDRAMAQMDVTHLADRGVLSLSGGEKQRVLIARALVQQPTVLVLDEPTNHLDLRHQLRLLTLLRSTRVSVLVVLHDLNLAAAACDRIAMLADGRLVANGTPRQVLTPDRIGQVFGVDATVVDHPLTGDPQVLFNPAGLSVDPAFTGTFSGSRI